VNSTISTSHLVRPQNPDRLISHGEASWAGQCCVACAGELIVTSALVRSSESSGHREASAAHSIAGQGSIARMMPAGSTMFASTPSFSPCLR
jgi:hypothetical protein